MTLAVAAIVLYAILGIASAVLVARARRRPLPPAEQRRVSVIIAARDEEVDLPGCLSALAMQEYPHDLVEFIIVDDESEDATADIILEWARRDARFHYQKSRPLEDHPVGKAAALHSGIEAAGGDLLLFTDADCTPPREWVAAMNRAMADRSVGIIGGVTRVVGSTLHAKLQAVDWTLLKGVAAGWSLAGFPLTAMGNNMAVRSEAYEETGGYPQISPSVTEDYALFQAVARRTTWDVRLDPRSALENDTAAVEGVTAFFRQRRRWARGALAASPAAFAFYVIVFAAHLLPLLLIPLEPLAVVLMIAVKVLTDVVVVASAARASQRWEHLLILPIYEIYLYAYVLLLPLSLAIAPNIGWKGRSFN